MSKSNTKTGRGPKPSELTICMLCANAAGRCEFEGCNEYVFQDNLTLRKFNKSNVAHIVASSSEGPRGDNKRSYELSDKLSNLMLMCPEHHKLIDDSVNDYPEDKLIEMKMKHEERVRELCSLMCAEPSERVKFFVPIKNCSSTHIDDTQTAEAMLPNKKPATQRGITISLSSDKEYKSNEYWNDLNRLLVNEYQRKVRNVLDYDSNTHFSVFPLAPIPLIIKLGYLFMDKTGVDIYQKFRQPDTWEWIAKDKTNSFSKEKIKKHDGNKVALILSLTYEIGIDRIESVYDADIIYIIRAKNQNVDCIKSLDDLSEFWHLYQEICDEARNIDHTDEICVFPAMPVSAAFEVGRRYMPNVYPKLCIFDECNGFVDTTIIIGED